MQFVWKPRYVKYIMVYLRAEEIVIYGGVDHSSLAGNSDTHNRLNTKRD